MHIYKSEKELEKVILASNKSCMSVKLNLRTEKPEELCVSSILDDITDKISSIDLPDNMHPDLLYGSSILVSTNMNHNDDIFLPEETFAAKDTPINTPFNVEHESSDIIGHIISSKVVDKDGTVLESVLPDQLFNIEVGFVIYKFIHPDLASKIVTLASVDKQFVSMECILGNFDYGLVDEEGNISVVERNESTSFLTKHLRRFGGSGKYENKRLGRVLKDIRFVGMGSVDEPANPDSKFTQFKVLAEKEKSLYESKDNTDIIESENQNNLDNKECLLITAKGNVMKIENLDQALEKIQSLEDEKQTIATDLESVKNEKSTLEQSVVDVTAEKDSAQAELESIKSELEAEKQKVSVAEQEIVQLNETVEAKTSEAESKEQELAEATSKVQEFESAQVLANRVSELEGLGYTVGEDKVDDLKNMSDEVYASTLTWIKSIRKSDQTNDTSDNEDSSNASVDDLDNANVDLDNEIVDGGDSDEDLGDTKVAASLVKVLRAKAKRTS